MPTVNETLRDLSVRQAHFVERFKGGEARKLVAFYQRMESDLLAKLARRDPTAVRGRYTTLRLVKLLEDVREVLDGYGREYRADLLSSLDGFAEMEAGALVTQIAIASPVAIETVLPSAAQVRAAIRSQPFQGRLLKEYFEALDAATYARVRDAIRLGVAQGETMAQIAQRIRQATQISRRSAELVTRTAVSHVSNVARQATYEDNDDVISGVQWVATLDTRTSDLCKGLDGKVFPIDKGPRPPAHFRCRSSTTPVLRSYRDLGFDVDDAPEATRASMNGQVAESTTYSDWLKRQPASVQDEALGKTKGALFRRGGLPLEKFTDRTGAELNLDQLRERYAEAFAKAGV